MYVWKGLRPTGVHGHLPLRPSLQVTRLVDEKKLRLRFNFSGHVFGVKVFLLHVFVVHCIFIVLLAV